MAKAAAWGGIGLLAIAAAPEVAAAIMTRAAPAADALATGARQGAAILKDNAVALQEAARAVAQASATRS